MRALTTGKSRRKIKNPQTKVGVVMREYKHGTLHSGKSVTGPVVTNRKQAIAIALSEAGLSKTKHVKTGRKRNKVYKKEV